MDLLAQRVSIEELAQIARQAIAALDGRALVRAALATREEPASVEVWAIGKAAGAMMDGAIDALGARVRRALVIAKSSVPLQDPRITALVGAHPVPDERSAAAGQALVDAARAIGSDEPVLLLLSGGASALVGAPLPGVTLDELRRATDTLVRSGASIGEINTVRRHLALVAGGRLAQACRGRIDALVISDVIGSDPAAIGSGPVSPDPTTIDQARAIGLERGLDEALLTKLVETAKPGDPCFARVSHRILAGPAELRDAAVRAVEKAGLVARARPELVTIDVEQLSHELVASFETLRAGEVLVAAGEPTVRVSGDGRGGRAQHLALSLAVALAGRAMTFVACGSDGSDGPTDAAGAMVDGSTVDRARSLGLDPDAALARFDSHPLLAAVGATLVTGSTGTNATDLLLLAKSA